MKFKRSRYGYVVVASCLLVLGVVAQSGSALLTNWLFNTSGETSAVLRESGSAIQVNIQSAEQVTINGRNYVRVVSSGIPNYSHTMTADEIAALNNRQQAASDFDSGRTTVSAGQTVNFGQDIGYNNMSQQNCTPGAGEGYWPPGPQCPTNQNREAYFPVEPVPATTDCETGLGAIGLWVNGVAIYNWSDGGSYNNQGEFQNVAFKFEINDLDMCPGHSAGGEYHHHSHPSCLQEQLGDNGSGHSSIYGFAADGYPIYGPYAAAGVLAKSCWIKRDYDSAGSLSGCGTPGQRSCVLNDPYNLSAGTSPASGPSTSEIVTSFSGNSFLVESGYYLQDYYYDATCTAQGGEYLDEHNGHDHDGLGYHYHITREQRADGSFSDVFPYYVGPTFAGQLQDNALTSCGAGPGQMGGGGPQGGQQPPQGGQQPPQGGQQPPQGGQQPPQGGQQPPQGGQQPPQGGQQPPQGGQQPPPPAGGG